MERMTSVVVHVDCSVALSRHWMPRSRRRMGCSAGVDIFGKNYENPKGHGPEGGNWVFWVDWNALEGSDVSIGQTAMILPVHDAAGGHIWPPDPAEMESVFTQILPV